MNNEPSESMAIPAEAPANAAKIIILAAGTRAKGFTFAKGKTVEGVPIAHARYLEDEGKAQIIEVN